MMSGFEELFQAIYAQQMQPHKVEVDELQQGMQAQADQLAQLGSMGQNYELKTGMEEMMAALTPKEQKDLGYYGPPT